MSDSEREYVSAMSGLIEAQRELIAHLSDCAESRAVYLHAHGHGFTKEEADKGAAIAKRIAILNDKLAHGQ